MVHRTLDEDQRNSSGNALAPSSPNIRNAHRSLSPNASGASGASTGVGAGPRSQPMGTRRPSGVNQVVGSSTAGSPMPGEARTIPGNISTAPPGFSTAPN